MKIMIYGAGSAGQEAFRRFRERGEEPIGFFDSDVGKIGKTILGRPVMDFHRTRRSHYDMIVIASMYKEEIAHTLTRAGLFFEKDFICYNNEHCWQEFERGKNVFCRLSQALEQYCGVSLKGQNLLHIGSGRMAILDILCLLSGASKVYSIDEKPLQNGIDVTSIYSYLTYMLCNNKTTFISLDQTSTISISELKQRMKRIFYHSSGKKFVNMDYYQFYPFSTDNLPFGNELFAVSHSNAVLEHIRNPEPAIDEIARVLIPGGVSLHCIDLRDHRDNSNPYSHLSCSESEWEKLSINESSGYIRSNRWRGIEYKNAFEKAGFQILHYELIQPSRDIRNRFPAKINGGFKKFSREELQATTCLIYVRKKVI